MTTAMIFLRSQTRVHVLSQKLFHGHSRYAISHCHHMWESQSWLLKSADISHSRSTVWSGVLSVAFWSSTTSLTSLSSPTGWLYSANFHIDTQWGLLFRVLLHLNTDGSVTRCWCSETVCVCVLRNWRWLQCWAECRWLWLRICCFCCDIGSVLFLTENNSKELTDQYFLIQ